MVTYASTNAAGGLMMSCQLLKERVEEELCAAPFSVHCDFLKFVFYRHVKALEALSCEMTLTFFL